MLCNQVATYVCDHVLVKYSLEAIRIVDSPVAVEIRLLLGYTCACTYVTTCTAWHTSHCDPDKQPVSVHRVLECSYLWSLRMSIQTHLMVECPSYIDLLCFIGLVETIPKPSACYCHHVSS